MLAEDIHQWPTDPYRLLGVARESDPREVRQAYVRLIRRFRADKFPEHFRRIRAAYEQIGNVRPGASESPSHSPIVKTSAVSPRPSFDIERSQVAPSGEPSRQDPRSSGSGRADQAADTHGDSPVDAIREAWELATGGHPEKAYDRLLALRDVSDTPAAVYIRLYWLLTAMPELDRSHAGCDWLIEALVSTKLKGPAVELYNREVREDAELVLATQSSRLVNCPAQPRDYLRMLRIRWRALGECACPCEIVQELERSRPRFQQSSPDLWVGTLMLALGELAWLQGEDGVRKAFDQLHKELEEIGTSHGRFHEELASVDTLVALAEGWYQVPREHKISSYWLDFVRFSWTHEERYVRHELKRMIARIAMEPQRAFEELQWIKSNSETVFHYLGSLILDRSGQRVPTERRFHDGELERLLQQFLYLREDSPGSALSLALDFCLQEGVPPTELERRSEQIGRLLKEKLGTAKGLPFVIPLFRDDGSLNYVYTAWHHFWKDG